MKRWTKILKVMVFIMLFTLIFLYVNQVMGLKQLTKPWNMSTKVNGLRNEPKNTMDVMYFGSSHMYSSINPTLVWEETGIPSYNFATRQQPMWITYHYIKEALKYQKPKVMVVEVFMAKQQRAYADEAVNRTAIDLLPMSLNRMALIRASVPPAERAMYHLGFIKYHSRWKELKDEDYDLSYLKDTDPLKGYVMLGKTQPIEDREDISKFTRADKLSDKTYEYVQKIIHLAQEEDIRLVFYKAPSNATKQEKAYFNMVKRMAKEERIPYIDYNMLYEEIGLDPAYDFYDKGHVNYVGAEKVTRHFAAYLQETFNLPNRKGEEAYASWDACVDYYYKTREETPITPVEK